MATKTYRVQRKATIWYEVKVEASSESEALQLGMDKLNNGEGYEANDSFEFLDEHENWVGV
jgi:hypothetical protein